jgi:ribosomal protein L44E
MIRSLHCRQHVCRQFDRCLVLSPSSCQNELWKLRGICRRHPKRKTLQYAVWSIRSLEFSTSAHKRQNEHDNDEQSSQSRPKQDQIEKLTKHMELDFFGEPVTFLYGTSEGDSEHITKVRSNSIAAMDGFLLCAVSKGKSCTAGGDEGGIEVKSAHSAAVAWTEALVHAMIWNQDENNPRHKPSAKVYLSAASTMIAPMLAVVAVAPVLAQTGIAYVKHLDLLLTQAKSRIPGLPPVQMIDMARNAVQYKQDKEHFHERERMHLQALHFLLINEFPTALATYLRILRSCPGDALAMSLAMDLAWTLGDKQAAFRYVSICAQWEL